MVRSENLWSPASQENRWQEMRQAELVEHSTGLNELLETVCASEPFRGSPKSCEFLRHIVVQSLEGDTDVLKERLIGMALLGRDASYDTSTDAGVRVRANNVRKRLNAYNESLDESARFCFWLPAGTYIPVFLRSTIDAFSPEGDRPDTQIQELSFYRLAFPVVAALFLCIICMRWEFARVDSFLHFWKNVLPDDRALLYIEPPRMDGTEEGTATRELKFAAPLLDLAGQLHHRFTLVSQPGQLSSAQEMLVYVGAMAGSPGQPDSLPGLPDPEGGDSGTRFVVEMTSEGRKIFDRGSAHTRLGGGALLTIVNGPQRLIWIDGTDDASIASLVNRLCEESRFPATLENSFTPDTVTQAVFASSSQGEPTVVQLPLRRLHAALEKKL